MKITSVVKETPKVNDGNPKPMVAGQLYKYFYSQPGSSVIGMFCVISTHSDDSSHPIRSEFRLLPRFVPLHVDGSNDQVGSLGWAVKDGTVSYEPGFFAASDYNQSGFERFNGELTLSQVAD